MHQSVIGYLIQVEKRLWLATTAPLADGTAAHIAGFSASPVTGELPDVFLGMPRDVVLSKMDDTHAYRATMDVETTRDGVVLVSARDGSAVSARDDAPLRALTLGINKHLKDVEADLVLRENNFACDFYKDVSKEIQDDVMTRIVEHAWGYAQHKGVSIFDVEYINALNIEATGAIVIDGLEHSFHIRDGNNNGTEILGWNTVNEIERTEPDPYILIPHLSRVSDAIAGGGAKRLLQSWQYDIDGVGPHGQSLSKLPSSFAYDAHFAPGSGAAQSHARSAQSFGYSIGRQSEAVGVRKTLLSHMLKIIPIFPEAMSAPERLAHWAQIRDPATETGAAVGKAFDTILTRIAKDNGLVPDFDETALLKDMGVVVGDRKIEVAFRWIIWGAMISLEPIEGFDPETLPENPVAALFQALDRDLVRSTKVNAAHEVKLLTENLIAKMARSDCDDIPEHWGVSAEILGYRLVLTSSPP